MLILKTQKETLILYRDIFLHKIYAVGIPKCHCNTVVCACVCAFRKAIPTGMISGAAAQFLASPTDLVKVHMQMEGRRQLEGLKPRWMEVSYCIKCSHNPWLMINLHCEMSMTICEDGSFLHVQLCTFWPACHEQPNNLQLEIFTIYDNIFVYKTHTASFFTGMLHLLRCITVCYVILECLSFR